MRDTSGGFAVYLYCVGDGRYQVFIKNNSADVDFVRLAIGYTKRSKSKFAMWLDREWIISPLTANDEHVCIADVTKQSLTGLRIWVAFEGVKRGNKNIITDTFLALSLTPRKWRIVTGSRTEIDIRNLGPQKTTIATSNN